MVAGFEFIGGNVYAIFVKHCLIFFIMVARVLEPAMPNEITYACKPVTNEMTSDLKKKNEERSSYARILALTKSSSSLKFCVDIWYAQ